MKKLIIVIVSIVFVSLVAPNGYCAFFSSKPEIKYLLAVMPVENLSGDDNYNDLLASSSDILFKNIYKKNKFRLIEMDKIGDIIGEDFVSNMLYNKDQYLKAVKSLGAEVLLYCSLRAVNVEKTSRGKNKIKVIVDARLVRLLNGEIICMENVIQVSKMKNLDISVPLNIALKKLAKFIARSAY
ncbi:MAG: hypothetical protein ACD_79C00334G0004 [uncultured bacterium]|nr:MAG: hypothetical protein ACD_79C00334G0004 [uncultured bacterium]